MLTFRIASLVIAISLWGCAQGPRWHGTLIALVETSDVGAGSYASVALLQGHEPQVIHGTYVFNGVAAIGSFQFE